MNGISTYDLYGPGGKPRSKEHLERERSYRISSRNQEEKDQKINDFTKEIMEGSSLLNKILYNTPFVISLVIIIIGLILLIVGFADSQYNLLGPGFITFFTGLVLYWTRGFLPYFILQKEIKKQNKLNRYEELIR